MKALFCENMASLPELIKFRALAEQLEEMEFNEFLGTIVRKCGRSVVLFALSNQFSDQAIKADPSILATFIEIIEDIIRNRERKPLVQHSNLKIDSFSVTLTGNIVSFLNLWDHADVLKCCRAMYLKVSSPNTVQYLNLKQIADYSVVPIRRYSQIRKLKVNLSQFKDLVFPSNDTVFPRLTEMVIDNQNKSSADIDWLMQCSSIRWTNITHLTLRGFSRFETGKFPKGKFLKLLQRFPKLISLCLYGVYCRSKFTARDDCKWTQLLPDLQIFVDWGTSPDCADSIIRSRANQLKMASFSEDRHSIFGSDLRTLVEVGSVSPVYPVVLDVINSSPKLERFYIDLRSNCSTDALQLVTDVVSKQTNLTQCVIDLLISNLHDICGALERALFEIAEPRNKCIELKLRMMTDTLLSTSEIMFQISRLINQLQVSNFTSDISDYLLMLRYYDDDNLPDSRQWNGKVTDFAQRNSNQFDVSFSDRDILISSKGSKIGGCIRNYIFDGWLGYH